MLYGKSDQNRAVAEVAGAPAYANQFSAGITNGKALTNHSDVPCFAEQQSGSQRVAASPESGREGPLDIHFRGQAAYEEARVGRVFNLRRPDRYPAAVLNAASVHDGEHQVVSPAIGRVPTSLGPSKSLANADSRRFRLVVRGVKLAAERGLKVAIRSGGHSWAALS